MASEAQRARYLRAAHAMQTGVAFAQEKGDDEMNPKHLRVGINSAMSNQGALVRLLIEKEIFTEDEYLDAITEAMEQEAQSYEDKYRAQYPNIHFR